MSAGPVLVGEIPAQLGVRAGDLLMIESDALSWLLAAKRQGLLVGVGALLDAFLSAVGPDGTLVLPTYNWDFTQGNTYDIRRSPSKMGALSSRALRHPAFARTRHPICSFAVAGRHREAMVALNNTSCFADDSPLGFLRRHHGKLLLFGLPYGKGLTLVHHVEEMEKVRYRRQRRYTAGYIDEHGREDRRTYTRFEPRPGIRSRHTFERFGEMMEQRGVFERREVAGASCVLIPLDEAYLQISEEIRRCRSKNLFRLTRTPRFYLPVPDRLVEDPRVRTVLRRVKKWATRS